MHNGHFVKITKVFFLLPPLLLLLSCSAESGPFYDIVARRHGQAGRRGVQRCAGG